MDDTDILKFSGLAVLELRFELVSFAADQVLCRFPKRNDTNCSHLSLLRFFINLEQTKDEFVLAPFHDCRNLEAETIFLELRFQSQLAQICPLRGLVNLNSTARLLGCRKPHYDAALHSFEELRLGDCHHQVNHVVFFVTIHARCTLLLRSLCEQIGKVDTWVCGSSKRTECGAELTEIGSGAFIGSNTSLVAPVSVGENAMIGAGSTITKDVEDNALSVARGRQLTKSNWKK